MNSLNSRHKRFRIVLISAILFCAAIIGFLTNEFIQNQDCFFNSFANEQLLLVHQIAERSRDVMEEKKGNEDEVINRILKNAGVSGSRYWFLVKNNKLIFLKDDFELIELKRRNTENLMKYFETFLGLDVNKLEALLKSKKDGTALLHSKNNQKNVMVSIASFSFNNSEYSVGIYTSETYILSAGMLVKHSTYSFIAIITICLVFLSMTIIGVILQNRREEELVISQKALNAKNITIEELTGPSLKTRVKYNEPTRLYGNEVMYAVLRKANHPELFPFCILFIHLNYSDTITYYDLITELLPEIQKIVPENTITAKIDEDQLAILFLKTNYAKAKDTQAKLLKSWSSILKKLQVSVNTDVVTQFNGQDSPMEVFEFWRKYNKIVRGKTSEKFDKITGKVS